MRHRAPPCSQCPSHQQDGHQCDVLSDQFKFTNGGSAVAEYLAQVEPVGTLLTAEQFQRLADVPPEAQLFANLDSPQIRREYQNDLKAFIALTIGSKLAQRALTKPSVIATFIQLITGFSEFTTDRLRELAASVVSLRWIAHKTLAELHIGAVNSKVQR
jgi:hypothetical protein